MFSGVAKTVAEMRQGLEAGIKCFNVESEPELERLSMVAADLGLTAKVSVRINPDVDARTHAKISTGKSENKFGISYKRAREVYKRIAELPNIEAVGVALYSRFLFPFELAGLILLVAMIGAIVLTHRSRGDTRGQNIARQIDRKPGEAIKNLQPGVGEGMKL